VQSAPESGNELYGYEGIIKLRNKPFWIFDKEQHRLEDIRTIHPSFDKLLTALRTAVAHEHRLDKEQTAFDDILDAFRLSLQFYKRSKE
jgi:hypothetical protein